MLLMELMRPSRLPARLVADNLFVANVGFLLDFVHLGRGFVHRAAMLARIFQLFSDHPVELLVRFLL